MRVTVFFFLLILLTLSPKISAESYKGYGIEEGDSFQYFFTFNHTHITNETEIFDSFDLRELDFGLNDSVVLSNASSFEIIVGKYSGPLATQPSNIPATIVTSTRMVIINDIPQMLVHATNWEFYFDTLQIFYNQSSIPETEVFHPLDTDTEIGFYHEWRVDYYERDESFSQDVRYDKNTGMANYYKLDIINQNTDHNGLGYTSLTKATFQKTDDNIEPRFRIPFSQLSFDTMLIGLSIFRYKQKNHE